MLFFSVCSYYDIHGNILFLLAKFHQKPNLKILVMMIIMASLSETRYGHQLDNYENILYEILSLTILFFHQPTYMDMKNQINMCLFIILAPICIPILFNWIWSPFNVFEFNLDIWIQFTSSYMQCHSIVSFEWSNCNFSQNQINFPSFHCH